MHLVAILVFEVLIEALLLASAVLHVQPDLFINDL